MLRRIKKCSNCRKDLIRNSKGRPKKYCYNCSIEMKKKKDNERKKFLRAKEKILKDYETSLDAIPLEKVEELADKINKKQLQESEWVLEWEKKEKHLQELELYGGRIIPQWDDSIYGSYFDSPKEAKDKKEWTESELRKIVREELVSLLKKRISR